MRVSGHLYRAHERERIEDGSKAVSLDFEKARSWAAELGVRWEWLLNAEGLPWPDEDLPHYSPEARELADLADRLPEDERAAKVQAIKALLTGTGN